MEALLSDRDFLDYVKSVYVRMEEFSSSQEHSNPYQNTTELNTEYLQEYCRRHRRLLTPIFGWSALLIAGQNPDISILEAIQRNAKELVALIEELEHKLEERHGTL